MCALPPSGHWPSSGSGSSPGLSGRRSRTRTAASGRPPSMPFPGSACPRGRTGCRPCCRIPTSTSARGRPWRSSGWGAGPPATAFEALRMSRKNSARYGSPAEWSTEPSRRRKPPATPARAHFSGNCSRRRKPWRPAGSRRTPIAAAPRSACSAGWTARLSPAWRSCLRTIPTPTCARRHRGTSPQRNPADLGVLQAFLQSVSALVLLYCLAYNTIQIVFVGIAFHEVRRRLRSRAYEDLDIVFGSPFTPPLSIIVPAYNEEKTIVETLNSLVRLNFPRMEITYEDRITTAPVRGFYDKRAGLPAGVIRWVVIDKENGGKADALNAGINGSTCPFFLSMDADSIIDEDALLQAFRLMLVDGRIVAIGGQVALVNGCVVRNGQVQSVGIPSSHLARLQIVEYIRSFSFGRTALGYLDSILIISGVFGIFRKDIVLKTGGYLTRSLTGKIAGEYVGTSRETVCEDMEIIVRIQRYLREKRLKLRVGYTPHPLCWTEAPESLSSLAKQRNRWTRGLIETLVYHRKMFFSRRHGRIGWFAYPFFVLFEFLGAPLELLGYLGIPLMYALGLLSVEYLFLFLLVSVAYGALVSVTAVVTGAWSERASPLRPKGSSLLNYTRPGELAVLLIYALLENFGYRQLNLLWRVRGIWDYYFGKKGWEKFERIGFGDGQEARGGVG